MSIWNHEEFTEKLEQDVERLAVLRDTAPFDMRDVKGWEGECAVLRASIDERLMLLIALSG